MSNTPTPDTSKANTARVLRECATLLDEEAQTSRANAPVAAALSLADALDALEQQASVPWSERESDAAEAFTVEYHKRAGIDIASRDDYPNYRAGVCAALRAAFPELAPKEPTP